MLYYCEYTWNAGTTADQIRRKLAELNDAGINRPDRFRGWYALAGGGAGFLILEAADPKEVTGALQPWSDLLRWDVRAIYELDYQKELEQARQSQGAGDEKD